MKTIGLIAAPPTGFREDGTIDLAVPGPLAAHLHAQGVSGVFINGTTGEGASLTITEREQLATEWRRVLPAGMKLFVHVGHNSLGDARHLARHAAEIGADAVAAIAPGYFRPGLDELIDWCAQLAGMAPELPFYFYHMPSVSGVALNVTGFLDKAGQRVPNLAGIKFTHENLLDYFEALRLDDGRYDLLWGRDEILLGALVMGARGAVGSTYNIFAALYHRLISAFEAGDLTTAREAQAQAVICINKLAATGHFFAALKAVLRAQGVPIRCAVRQPLPVAPVDQLMQTAERMRRISNV